MKKVLLTLSLVASSLLSIAQVTIVPVYKGGLTNAEDSVNSEDGFVAFPTGCQPSFTSTEVTEGSGNIYLKLTGSSAGYYVCGVNNGNYSSAAANVPFGYTGTDGGYVAFRVKAANTDTRVKIGLQTTDGKTFAKELDLATVTGATAGFVIYNMPFSDMLEEDANGNTIGVAPTAGQLATVGQINVILVVQSWCADPTSVPGCSGTPGTVSRYGEFWIDDIYMTQSQLTSIPTSVNAAQANISSSNLYPNPVSDMARVELNLKSASAVKVTLSDLMGKEVMTIEEGTFSTLKKDFSVAGLNKGIYSVNYTINGQAAKADMLMVK